MRLLLHCLRRKVAEAATALREEERMMRSASDFSCQSYEMFVGQQQQQQQQLLEQQQQQQQQQQQLLLQQECRSTDDAFKEKMTSLQSVADDVDSTTGAGDARVKINGRVRKVPVNLVRFGLIFPFSFLFFFFIVSVCFIFIIEFVLFVCFFGWSGDGLASRMAVSPLSNLNI